MTYILDTVRDLENFGRVRLSQNFFMRDFMHSEVSQVERILNIPRKPDLAIQVGRQHCQTLLEPLQDTFGRIAIRSAFRSGAVNHTGSQKGHGCASNEKNRAGHIWDELDAEGYCRATACIVIPWFLDLYENGEDWRAMALWIHDHLDYSSLYFFPRLCAFNISWHECPVRVIPSFISSVGTLTRPSMANHAGSHVEWYRHWGR